MVHLIGFVFSIVFGTLFGTSKFALRNAVRVAAFGLVGYLVYELVVGYSQGQASAAPAPTPATPPAPQPAPAPAAAAAASAGRSPLVGGGDHTGRAVQVDDGGAHRTTVVGRGVIRR